MGCRAPALFVAAFSGVVSLSVAQPVVTLENNQPFKIHMPITVRGLALGDSNWITNGRQAVQTIGSNAVFIAEVSPGAQKRIRFKAGSVERHGDFALKPATNGVALVFSDQELGRLNWDILLKPVKEAAPDGAQVATHESFDAAFLALPLTFRQTAQGPIFATWMAETTRSGLQLRVELLAYHDGFLDINSQLLNESADVRAKVYAAVVCRWEQSRVKSRTLCYDNRIAPLGARAASPFRSGEGRHQFTQRGVDWVNTAFAGASVAWLNDFAPSFTLLDNSTRNSFKQPRYEGASLPQLGQEVQTAGEHFYSITEIARANIKSYRDRLAENTLPARREGVTFSSRLVFSKPALTDKRTDEMLVGFTSYNEQQKTPDGAAISFGVKSVRFGTSYFPYSTLGENFDTLKLPGMDREAFWPLAADTVLRWRDFADDVRRDLRIAKFMGFQFIRLHHLELLAPIPKDVRQEYLDFLFGELRHLKLRALLDTYASDAAIVELLKRYGDVIDAVEIENEVLIWGIPLDRPPQWKATYAAVKQTTPHVRVHLTGYNNTGIFNRLESLGVPFDRVGLHSYMDSLDAIPTARGYALALGSFGSKIGKPPVITEWNWRQLTRMTPEARAKIYQAVFDNALATRAIPEMYQFQFNETLAPNPRSGRGNVLRHYELINLSRRPKLEAFELMKLIQKYSASDDALRVIDVPQIVVNLGGRGRGEAAVKIRNTSRQTLQLAVTVESPADVKAALRDSDKLVLRPGHTKSVPVTLTTSDMIPGFYHCFLRLEGSDGLLRYGWIEARFAGLPKLDTESKSAVAYLRGVAEELKFDFAQPFTVVYGTDAPVLEVETAFAIASTLESASGHPIEAIQLSDFPNGSGRRRNVIFVGTPESNELINSVRAQLADAKSGQVMRVNSPEEEEWMVVSGEDSLGVEHAGMDLLLRWWKNAKDSAARRVGLVEKELPRGGDATKLP